jgi:hypothetical protein
MVASKKKLGGLVMKKLMTGLALSGLLLAGCGGRNGINATGPDWVTKGNAAFKGDNGTIIRGVGLASYDPNKNNQIDLADARARKNVGAVVSTHIEAELKNFEESHKDYYNPDAAGSEEITRNEVNALVDTDLRGSEIVDHYTDPSNGDLYSLAELDVNNTFYEAYKELLKKSVREEHRAEMEEHQDAFDKDVDADVAQQRQNEAAVFGATAPASAVTTAAPAGK